MLKRSAIRLWSAMCHEPWVAAPVILLSIVSVAFAGKACFVSYGGDANWPCALDVATDCISSAPCTGTCYVNIGDLTEAHTALSCDNATTGRAEYCTTTPEATCNISETSTNSCVTATAYYTSAACAPPSCTLVEVTIDCSTSF